VISLFEIAKMNGSPETKCQLSDPTVEKANEPPEEATANQNPELSDKVQNVIKKLAEELGVKDPKLEITSGSNKGDNYLGIITKVKATGNGGPLSFIVKMAFSEPNLRQFVPIRKFYLREILMYCEVLDRLDRLQIEGNVTPKDRFCFPKCHRTFEDECGEGLIMADLNAEGYRMFNRLDSLDLPHVELAIRKLAAYHASWFALKKDDPEFYARIVAQASTADEFNEQFPKFLNDLLEQTIKILETDEEKDKMRVFGADIYDKMMNAVYFNDEETHRIICHGDCWTNNFLFKYKVVCFFLFHLFRCRLVA
jgi:hypothetical protein